VGVGCVKKKSNIISISLFVAFVIILAINLKIDYVPKNVQDDLGNDLTKDYSIFQIDK
jgi:hypothetical protein